VHDVHGGLQGSVARGRAIARCLGGRAKDGPPLEVDTVEVSVSPGDALALVTREVYLAVDVAAEIVAARAEPSAAAVAARLIGLASANRPGRSSGALIVRRTAPVE
jgi:hypothetical protein